MTHTDSDTVHVVVDGKIATFCLSGETGGQISIPWDVISRSILLHQALSDAIEDVHHDSEVHLSLPQGVIEAWLDGLAALGVPVGSLVRERACKLSEGTHASMDALKYLEAADFLEDREACTALCKHIGEHLIRPAYSFSGSPDISELAQELVSLPDSLHQPVLAFAQGPLLLQLAQLPEALHDAALRAAYPSISTYASITVDHLSDDTSWCRAFWQAVVNVEGLRELRCTERAFVKDGSSIVIQNIGRMTGLVSLSLAGLSMGHKSGSELASCLLRLSLLTQLDLSSCSFSADEILTLAPRIAELKRLRCLNLPFVGTFSAVTTAVARLTGLESLRMGPHPRAPKDSKEASMAVAQSISGCSQLTQFVFYSWRMIPDLVIQLCALSRLRHLEVLLPEGGVQQQLQHLTSLKVLKIKRTLYCGGAVNLVPQIAMLTSLQELHLDSCFVRDDVQVSQLGQYVSMLTGLTVLNLRSNLISCAHSSLLQELIPKLRSLREIDLSSNYAYANPYAHGGEADGHNGMFSCFASLPDLEVLRLGMCDVGCAAVMGLSADLLGINHLTELDLSCNSLRSQGAIALASYLPKLPLLQNLNLAATSLSEGDIRDIIPLSNPIGQLRALTKLDLKDVYMSEEDMAALSPQLSKLSFLVILNLKRCHIGSQGATQLSKCLGEMTSLHKLSLYGCEVKDAGAEALAPALGRLTDLKYLNLGENDLTDAAAQSLAPAIANLVLLQTLRLSANPYTNEGLLALVPSISRMVSLQDLYIDSVGTEETDADLHCLSQDFCSYQVLTVHERRRP